MWVIYLFAIEYFVIELPEFCSLCLSTGSISAQTTRKSTSLPVPPVLLRKIQSLLVSNVAMSSVLQTTFFVDIVFDLVFIRLHFTIQ